MSRHSTIIERDREQGSRGHAFWRRRGTGWTLVVGILFCLIATGIVISGRYHSGYRIGQYVTEPIRARADFAFFDKTKFEAAQQRARELEPRVYRNELAFSWSQLEEQVKRLPEIAGTSDTASLPPAVRKSFDNAGLLLLVQYQTPERKPLYSQRVETFFAALKKLIVLPPEQHEQELGQHAQWRASGAIKISEGDSGTTAVPLEQVRSSRNGSTLNAEVNRAASDAFREDLAPEIASFVINSLQPTHSLDLNATAEAKERAAATVLSREGEVQYKSGVVIKASGEISERDLDVLKAEHLAYRQSLPLSVIVREYIGILGAVAVLTMLLGWYLRRYQSRIVRNTARAAALATLLAGMLLLSHLAASGTRPLYIFGVAPTILTAIVLAIAYEPRFALGVAMMLAILTTIALNQPVEFILVLLGGSAAACAYTGIVRTRSRLIEIGLASAMAMFAITMFCGVWAVRGAQPFEYVAHDAIYAAIAGIAAGFVVLGILPFVEKAFRITTGMTLSELSDASHPLQRKMAAEAPGTYSHSVQVAAIAEAAAEAIGADSLLARVGALYHDIGKIKRPHYFCENQRGDNAHLSLSPGVSFMIILEHIKDGIELAREHNLPTNLFPFIQQHHGTTLVEFFFHEARKQNRDSVIEGDFRYPGPKPRSREIAIVMLADACESAARSLDDPTSESLEKMIHELMLKRLLDGQLSDCDLTMRELDTVEKTIARTLQSVHHVRVAYPDVAKQSRPAAAAGGN